MHSIAARPLSGKKIQKKAIFSQEMPRTPLKSAQFGPTINKRPRNGRQAHPNRQTDPRAEKSTFSVHRQRKLSNIPPRVRKYYQRAWAKKSRKAAIRAYCLSCCGYSSGEVAECTAPACPLHEFRLKG